MIFVVVLSFDKIVLELLLWIRALLSSSDGYRRHILSLTLKLFRCMLHSNNLVAPIPIVFQTVAPAKSFRYYAVLLLLIQLKGVDC